VVLVQRINKEITLNNWKDNARIDCARFRDRKLNELRESVLLSEKLNQDINVLEKQMQCKHEVMLPSCNAELGGYSVDICENCGYEYIY